MEMIKDELIRIYANLVNTNKDIYGVTKCMKKFMLGQSRFNKNVSMFAAVCVAYAIHSENNRKKQNDRIKALEKELEELKGNMEGE